MIAIIKNLFRERERERNYKLSTHLFLSFFLLFVTLGCNDSNSSQKQEPTATTYSWSLGDWDTCSGDCGTDNATETRTVTCTASTGGSVADGMCSGTKPATTQACTASICPTPEPEPEPTPVVTYSWSTSSWGTCSGDCGTNNATQSRTVTCTASTGGSVADGMCSGTKPATTQVCTASICPLPPIMGDIPNQALKLNVAMTDLNMSNYVTLTEDDPITTYTLTGTLIAGLDFNTTTGLLTGTPTASGVTTLSLTATDKDGESNSYSFTITVNAPPLINSTFTDISLVQNNATTNYELNISDADGDELTVSVESNDTSILTVTPNWTNPINQATYATALDFNLTTVDDAFGMANITIIVDDGEDNDTTSFDVNVTEIVTVAIKKTGQTKSYDSAGNEVTDDSFKDDGFYQTGIDHNYTRDDTNNIVTDNVTGLMWQDDTNVSSVTKPWLTSANYTTCETNTSSPACYDTSGDTAATYCSDLTLGGYENWRLPSAEELEGIVDYGKVSPTIDTVYFENTTSLDYWSATTYEGGKNSAWYVYFNDGYVYDGNKRFSLYVRCVRGGQ